MGADPLDKSLSAESRPAAPPVLGYVLAVAAPVAAALVRLPLEGTLHGRYPFLTFFPAVALAGWMAGLAGGLLATAISTVLVCLLLPPVGSLQVASRADVLALILFVMVNLLVSLLLEAMHQARVGAAEAAGQLYQQRQLADVTLASIGDGLIVTDARGRVTYLNAVAEKLTGWPLSDAVGQPCAKVFHIVNEQTRKLVESPVDKVLATGTIVGLANHTVLLARDGREMAIDDSGAPIRLPNGGVAGVVLVFRDVSERRRIELEQKRLAAIVESSDDAIIAKDLDGIITSWNPAAERIFGYSAAEMVGKPITTIVPPDRTEELAGIMQRLRSGEKVDHFETQRVRRDGQRIDVSLSISPIHDSEGHIIGVSKISRDITHRKAAERQVRESEGRFQAMADAAPVLIWVSDVEKLATWFNRGWLEFTGRAMEKELGAGWLEGVHAEDIDRLVEAYKSSFDARQAFRIEYRLRRRDGEHRWVLDQGVPRLAPDGTFLGYIGCCIDITDRRQAEEQLARYAASLEERTKLLDLAQVMIRRLDGRVLYWNRGAEKLYGWDEREAIGKSTHELFQTESPEPLEEINAKLVSEGQWQGELTHRRKDGSRITVASLWVLHRDSGGRPAAVLEVNNDITAQKRAEAERERLLVSEREARAEAERVSRLKDEFLATLSHELRTPLNAILGWAQVLRMSPTAPDLASGLETIERNARVQTVLIEDLLDMSRIISGKLRMNLQAVDVAAVLKAAIETVQPAAEARQIPVKLEVVGAVPQLRADPARLQQVAWNLLSNAIRFTPAQGRVDVKVEPVERAAADSSGATERLVRITVADTGKGIEASFLPHLFERFRQADASSTRAHGGLGLGLAIVRHLVELHGGTVSAWSAGENQGAAFTVELPASAAAVEAANSAPAGPVGPEPGRATPNGESSLAGKRILLVDDEADARVLLRRMLEERGCQVSTAGSCEEAIELAGRQEFDLLLSDIAMPECDGYELLGKVRGLRPERPLPAVAITAYAREEDRERAQAAGFQGHVSKPVDAGDLVGAIAAAAGASGVDGDNERANH